ncbi:unnamed protein product [Rotaria socialis]|uniref:V-SNARE coiled-coil homology domain-containing protein n=1 Tax=Rotaria socialis TaxID=392032 RepID=A0A820U2J3_9BILA|nr:unnamed protein product [Rotaria socialis]CAF4478626.1 unnamed protein product [Rotaria socialis]CAF4482668.1 unnamed protein product [Rotaria socialis]CAF4588435.1 unnamed protein product [Rotaria socialis]CAF4730004.1 unnamed protein product [Rotaria socialis]
MKFDFLASLIYQKISTASKKASSYENPPRATQYQSSKRFDNLQADVNQVVDVMKDNLDKVLERDAKLTTLENRAEVLQTGASQFTTNASKLKRKYWWKNVKVNKLMHGADDFMYLSKRLRHVDHSHYCYYRFDYCYCWTTNGAGGPPGGASGGGSKRLAQQQAQVDEVVDIMRQNVDKVLERDKNLSLLDDRADKLQHNAAQFEQHAGKLKRKYWWKNMKQETCVNKNLNHLFFYLAWIGSKVKSETPALPSGGVTTAVPSASGESIPGGSKDSLNGDKPTKKPRGSRRPKSKPTPVATTPSSGATATATPSSDGEPEPSEADDSTKEAIKRVIRALVNRS